MNAPLKQVLVIDDHKFVGESVMKLFVDLETDIEAKYLSSMEAAIEELKDGQSYDLILLDQEMPEMKGLAGLDAIKDINPEQEVGMISGVTDTAIVLQAISKGAIGWIPKTVSGAPLVRAVQTMLEGGQFVPSDIFQKLQEEHEMRSIFSTSEQPIVDGLLKGISDKEIAAEVGSEYRTVQSHVRNILRKSNCDNRTKFALRYKT